MTMARCLTWMEQQNRNAVGLRWSEKFVCYVRRSNFIICIQCCKFPVRTVDPQDSGMERTTGEVEVVAEETAGFYSLALLNS